MALYDPTVFNAASERQARDIILTPEAGMSPDERWVRETPDVIARILRVLGPPEGKHILDWGCGIGRLSKPLVEMGAAVTGVDISADMRRLAESYVGSPSFRAMEPTAFAPVAGSGLPGFWDAAIASWVLQHIPKVEQACQQIRRALKPGAPLFVLNRVERVIPIVGGWTPDGKDVPTALRAAGFNLEVEEALTAPLYAAGSVWSVWRAA